MMIVLGIDPGKTGGLIALNQERQILLKEIMPQDPMDIYSLIKDFYKDNPRLLVFLEHAAPRPVNGIKAIHSFAFHNGQIDMILQILKVPYELVHPHIWSRYMHAGTSADRPKEKSKQAVKRLFPEESLTNPDDPRSRMMHEGLMEALLIAEYGLRKLGSGLKQ